MDSNTLLNIGLVVLLVVVVIFMFRNSRKRRKDAEELQNQMVPGAEVMTQHGIYGTLLELDSEKNEAIIETTPGTRIRVHSQTLAKVVEPTVAAEDEPADATPAIAEGEPEFGERRPVDEKPNDQKSAE